MENQTNNANPFANVQFFNAVGKRTDTTSKTEADVIIAEGTVGSFKMMPDVALALGVKDGSFVTVVTAEIEGQLKVFIGKGKDGVLAKNEDGSVKVDNRKRRVFEVEGYGAMVSEVTPGTNVLRFSVASAWKDLDMKDGEVKKVFKLGEGFAQSLSIGEGQTLETVLHEIIFVRDEAKQATVGTKKAKTEEAPAPEGLESGVADVQALPSEPTDSFDQGFIEDNEL